MIPDWHQILPRLSLPLSSILGRYPTFKLILIKGISDLGRYRNWAHERTFGRWPLARPLKRGVIAVRKPPEQPDHTIHSHRQAATASVQRRLTPTYHGPSDSDLRKQLTRVVS
jgi:hypothetical protein